VFYLVNRISKKELKLKNSKDITKNLEAEKILHSIEYAEKEVERVEKNLNAARIEGDSYPDRESNVFRGIKRGMEQEIYNRNKQELNYLFRTQEVFSKLQPRTPDIALSLKTIAKAIKALSDINLAMARKLDNGTRIFYNSEKNRLEHKTKQIQRVSGGLFRRFMDAIKYVNVIPQTSKYVRQSIENTINSNKTIASSLTTADAAATAPTVVATPPTQVRSATIPVTPTAAARPKNITTQSKRASLPLPPPPRATAPSGRPSQPPLPTPPRAASPTISGRSSPLPPLPQTPQGSTNTPAANSLVAKLRNVSNATDNLARQQTGGVAAKATQQFASAQTMAQEAAKKVAAKQAVAQSPQQSTPTPVPSKPPKPPRR